MELHIANPGPLRSSVIGEDSPPEELVAWSVERFGHMRMAITTAFGMEGCALIDMYAKHGRPMSVIYLDTMFFFEETHRLRRTLQERYPHIRFVNKGTTLTPEQQADQYGPELWKTSPDQCCKIRKVEPMDTALADVDVWITGLRKSQSATRTSLRVVEWDWKFQVFKVNPLANMERGQIWEYIQEHQVPYNELHEKGYPSIGCTHCTKAVAGATAADYTRAGRWNGTQKTECGLHGYGI